MPMPEDKIIEIKITTRVVKSRPKRPLDQQAIRDWRRKHRIVPSVR